MAADSKSDTEIGASVETTIGTVTETITEITTETATETTVETTIEATVEGIEAASERRDPGPTKLTLRRETIATLTKPTRGAGADAAGLAMTDTCVSNAEDDCKTR